MKSYPITTINKNIYKIDDYTVKMTKSVSNIKII